MDPKSGLGGPKPISRTGFHGFSLVFHGVNDEDNSDVGDDDDAIIIMIMSLLLPS